MNKTMNAPPKAPKNAGPALSADERKWRAKDDMRTLSMAEEIRSDPVRMKEAAGCAEDEMRKLASIKVEVAPKTMRKAK